MRQPSAKQLNNIILSFKKYDRKAYEQIAIAMDQLDLSVRNTRAAFSKMTNYNIISHSKSKEKARQKLYSIIKQRYGGSYTEYQKRKRRRYKRYKDDVLDEGNDPLSQDEYEDMREDLNELYEDLYKNIDSDEARVIMDITEAKFINGQEQDALNYLKNNIKNNSSQNNNKAGDVDYDSNPYQTK